MVTAGVYMVARSSAIFERAPMAMMVVAIIGTLTALFAATIGIAQTDIKKVLAYSTISQLGYMFMACGVGAFSAGIFHLMTHAFFKGLLFLAAGSVIHGIGGEQDMRKMGGLRVYMPVTFITMSIATFTITGFPPLAAYFSKDEILWKAYSSPQGSWVYWLIGVITAFLTSFYMFRLWFLTFFGDYRGGPVAHEVKHQSCRRPRRARQTCSGRPRSWRASRESLGHAWPAWSSWRFFPLSEGGSESVAASSTSSLRFFTQGWRAELAHETASEAAGTGTETLLMLISVAAAVLGLLLAWALYHRRPQLPDRIAAKLGGLYQAVAHKYYIDELYAALFVKPLIEGSTTILWYGIDQGAIDAAVNDSADAARHVSDNLRHMQSGNLRSYAGWVAAGGAVVIAYMVWMGIR